MDFVNFVKDDEASKCNESRIQVEVRFWKRLFFHFFDEIHVVYFILLCEIGKPSIEINK